MSRSKLSVELNKLRVTRSWGSHGVSAYGVGWERWTGSEDGETTWEELQKEQKENRENITQDWSEMRTGDQRPIFFVKVAMPCIKLSIPTGDAVWGEKLSATPAEHLDIEITITGTGRTYRWSAACGWQVADPLAISDTGRVTLKSFRPRCDSFLGSVLRDLGIAVTPLKESCDRSCCWG